MFLVGFMGCGKTTVGRLLAEELGWTFADLDDDIEARENAAISRIFAERGEAEFRRIETECLKARVEEIRASRPLVVAAGGLYAGKEPGAGRGGRSGDMAGLSLRADRKARGGIHAPAAGARSGSVPEAL